MSTKLKLLAASSALGWLVAVPLLMMVLVGPLLAFDGWPAGSLGGREPVSARIAEVPEDRGRVAPRDETTADGGEAEPALPELIAALPVPAAGDAPARADRPAAGDAPARGDRPADAERRRPERARRPDPAADPTPPPGARGASTPVATPVPVAPDTEPSAKRPRDGGGSHKDKDRKAGRGPDRKTTVKPQSPKGEDPSAPKAPGSGSGKKTKRSRGGGTEGDPGEGHPGKSDPGKSDPGKGHPGNGGDPGKSDPGKSDPGKSHPGHGKRDGSGSKGGR